MASVSSSTSGSVSSPGIGSGLDVNSIVSQLVAIERRPIDLLDQQTTELKTKLSSFGLIQSYTTNINDAVARLTKDSYFKQTTASTTDPTSVSVSTTGTTTTNTQYSIKVNQLAQGQSLASQSVASSTTVMGTGTIKIELGTWNTGKTLFTSNPDKTAVDVTIDSTGNTLEAVRDKINGANAGVTASIVKDASGARLIMRSTSTGEDQSMRITVTDGDGNNTDATGLSQLAYDPEHSVNRMTEKLTAQNALATVDGLDVSSKTNTFDNVLDGLKFTVNQITTNPVQVKNSLDTTSIVKGVNDFIKSYNDLNKY